MRQEKTGIWRFANLLPPVISKYQITLNEGTTPLELVDQIIFKCEYENPTGSLKDRGICFQVARLLQQNIKAAVISSSGNAAISAARYCNLTGINLTVFVSPKINPFKLKMIKNAKVIKTLKPVSSAIKYAKERGSALLRQSTDPFGNVGFETISFELLQEQPEIDAIFIPVSSGTALKGIYRGFVKLKKKPAIHLVQTTSHCPLARKFDHEFQKENHQLADALVAKFIPLELEILQIVNESKGWGWVISNQEMMSSLKWLNQHKLDSSFEGAAALAAIYKAKKNGASFKKPVCLLTGKFYPVA